MQGENKLENLKGLHGKPRRFPTSLFKAELKPIYIFEQFHFSHIFKWSVWPLLKNVCVGIGRELWRLRETTAVPQKEGMGMAVKLRETRTDVFHNFHVSLRYHRDYRSVCFGWKIRSGRQNSRAEVSKYSHLINMLIDRQIVISNDNLFNRSDGLWTRSD